jgi:hypothetical protein
LLDLLNAIERGVEYLLSCQFADGHWEDYELPVGRSDAWITGYVGLALVNVERYGFHARSEQAVRRAASWLFENRSYSAGWGYNAITGPDADSTGYALQLLNKVGYTITNKDEEWLLARWQPDGGFSTYEGQGAWGKAHPDVTPVAFMALPPCLRLQLGSELFCYLLKTRDIDGTWPSYWWRTRHYSTYLSNCLIQTLGFETTPMLPVVTLEESRAVHSIFDLVFVTANAFLYDNKSNMCRDLAAELLFLQAANGSWAGAKNLRVMRHDTKDPWNCPEGDLYEDNNHLITTASAVRVLTEMQAQWKELL